MVHQEKTGPTATGTTITTTTEEEKKHDGADDVVVGGGETKYTHLRDMNEMDAKMLDKRFLELASAEALTVRLLCDQLYNGGKNVVLAGRVSLLGHAVESATRAYRAGESEEFVVAALLHDIGELLTPVNHGEVAAALLRPYVLPETDWALSAHECFQFYHYSPAYPGLGIETEADREGPRNTAASGNSARTDTNTLLLEKKKKDHEDQDPDRVPFRIFETALRFSEYDAASFGGINDTPSLEFFAPMVCRVLSRPPYWALERCAESLPNTQQQNISLGKSQIQQCYFPPAEETEEEEEPPPPPLLRWCLNDNDPATDDSASKEVAKKVAVRVMGKDNNVVCDDDTTIVYDTPFPNGSAPWSGGGPPPPSSSSAENSSSNDGTIIRNKKNNSGSGFRVLSPSTYEFEDIFSSSDNEKKHHHHRDLLESLLRDGIVLVTGLPHDEEVADAAADEKDAAAKSSYYHAHALVEQLFVPREGGTCSNIPFWEARGMTHHVHPNVFENSGAPNAHASYGSTLLPMHTDGSYLETAPPRVKALATIDYKAQRRDGNNTTDDSQQHRHPPFNTFTDGFFALQRGIDSGILSVKDVELLRKVSVLHSIVDKEDSKPIYAWTKILSYDGDGRAVLKWNAHDRAKKTTSSSLFSSHHKPPPADPTPWELIITSRDNKNNNDAINDDDDDEEEEDVSSSYPNNNNSKEKLRRYLEESVLPRVDKLLQDPQHMLYVRLDPGTMAICDNYRVLHGRERFTSQAKRRIAGADIADVALRAKWRELSSSPSSCCC